MTWTSPYLRPIRNRYYFPVMIQFSLIYTTVLRGVPTEGRKPCDYRYRCIERVCRSVGTLILCDFCYFRSRKTTKITWDGLRPSSNMLNISVAMGMFSYSNWSKCSVGTPIFNGFQWLSISLAIFQSKSSFSMKKIIFQ